MHRCFATLSTVCLLAATAAAQCLNTSSPGATLGSGDETLFAPVAMGISFPMAGAVGGPFTHCAVSTNGVLFLTTGGAPSDASGSSYGGTAELSGAVGASPRVAPFWNDLVETAPAGFVAVDTSVSGRCAVTWVQAREFFGAVTKSFQCELFSTGVVRFSYSTGMSCELLPATVGLSVGNAIASSGVVDLSGTASTATGIVHQLFDPALVPFDLAGRTLTFTPSGGGYQVATTCEGAGNSTYGSGCYAVATESFYQYLPTAAAAAAALNGQSMTLLRTPTGYSASWGGGSFVAPSGAATVLAVSDDGEVAITPSSPLPMPSGTASTLFVHTNGFISTAAGNLGGAWNAPSYSDYTPSAQFRNAPATAFWSWHDYDTTSGAGRIKYEQVVGPSTMLYVTWDAVESYPTATSNPSTFQFQFNLTTGAVTYVWQNLTAIGTGGNPNLPESHLVGFSTGGTSLDPGSVTLATALPLQTKPDQLPLRLTASPAPVISPSTVVTYTATDLPEYLPASGVYVSTLFLSLGALPGGFDLGLIGAGGCDAYIASVDVDLGGQVTLVSSASWNLTFDNVVFAPGDVVFAQAVALVGANSLPNGQNAFGMTTSNGVRSFATTF